MLLYNNKCITSDEDASTDKLMGFSSSSAQNTIKNCIDFQIETMIAYYIVYIYQPPPPFSTFIPSLNSYIMWKNTIHLLKNFNVTKFNDVMSQVFTCQWNRCNEKNGSFNHLHIEYIHIALKVESLTSYKSSFQSLLSGNLSVVVPSFVITWTTTASPVYMSRSAADINTSFTRFTTFSFDKETLWTFCWFFKPIWKKDWNW